MFFLLFSLQHINVTLMLIVQLLHHRSLSGSALTNGVCILDLMRYGHQIQENRIFFELHFVIVLTPNDCIFSFFFSYCLDIEIMVFY